MAAPTKKRAGVDKLKEFQQNGEDFSGNDDVEENDDAAESSGSEEVDEQQDTPQEVLVEFEARNLEDSDFHGVRKLLSQLFLKANIDLSEMTNTMISQNYVGSAIKQVEDDEDEDDMDIDDETGQVFGAISVLNVTERKKLNCVNQLKEVLLTRCGKCTQFSQLAAILNSDDNQVGYIINERFINIPPQIALPSFQSLWKEVARAESKKMKYKFTHYLMVAKTCKLAVPGGRGDIVTFINREEELFAQEAAVRCEYSVKAEHDMLVQGDWDDAEEEMEPCRVVMVIPAEAIPIIMEKLKEAYG